MKKRLIICMESLEVNGVVKSLIDFLYALPADKYEISLLAFNPDIPGWVSIPEHVKLIVPPMEYVMYRLFMRQAIAFGIRKKCFGILLRRVIYPVIGKCLKSFTKERLVTRGRKINGQWDIAVAYSLGVLGGFVLDKINADKKLLWIHTDPREVEYIRFWKEYRQAAKDRAKVVCVSNGISNILRKDNPGIADRICCVHNIVDGRSIIVKSQASLQCFPKSDKLRIVTVGRFSPPKNQKMIPDIAHLLVKRGIDFEWLIVGPGANNAYIAEKDRLIALGVEEKLKYIDSTENPYPLMKSADIYVQPSSYEGWGLTLTEALVLVLIVLPPGILTPKTRRQTPQHMRSGLTSGQLVLLATGLFSRNLPPPIILMLKSYLSIQLDSKACLKIW